MGCINGIAHTKHKLNNINITTYQIGPLTFDKTVYNNEQEDNNDFLENDKDDIINDVTDLKNKKKDDDDITITDFFLNQYPKYTLRFISNTNENMKKISNALYTELSDDFIDRMYQSSNKILGQFNKTIDRYKKSSNDLYKSADNLYRWFLDDDDDDDDDFF